MTAVEILKNVISSYENTGIDIETMRSELLKLINNEILELEKQQQGYSEEDMKSAFKVGFSIGYGSDVHAIDEKNRTCEEWFEQFKKK